MLPKKELLRPGRVKIRIWVAVEELTLGYHNPEAILFTLNPYHGNLTLRLK